MFYCIVLSYLTKGSIPWRTENGRVLNKDVIQKANDIYETIEEEMEAGIKSTENISCEHYFRKRKIEELKSITPKYQHDVQLILNSYLKELGLYEGDDASKVSANLFPMIEEIEGEDITVTGGYCKVLQTLVDDIPSDVVRLKQRVTRIHWKDETDTFQDVRVYCHDGDKECTFCARHVIITCSLGHLKRYHKNLFHPSLPTWKTDAIEKFAFGQVEAVFLAYETPFWEHGGGCFMIASDDGADESIPKWFRSAYWVREIPTTTNVILIWLHGENSKEVSLVPRNEVAKTCTYVIRKFLNDLSIPEPSDVMVSSWCTDPLFLGAYSYYSTESDTNCVSNLAKPLLVNNKPVLCFAGEATHIKWSSFAHGASSSGIREAERLISLYPK